MTQLIGKILDFELDIYLNAWNLLIHVSLYKILVFFVLKLPLAFMLKSIADDKMFSGLNASFFLNALDTSNQEKSGMNYNQIYKTLRRYSC